MSERFTIKWLYDEISTGVNPALFGRIFSQSFMAPYVSNPSIFDKYFVKKYTSFEWEYTFGDGIHHPSLYFVDDFRSFVAINEKKFDELYRMEGIDDDKYSLYNNYDMIETSSGSASINTGSRTDTQSVAPYDTETFTGASQNEIGAQNNSSTSANTLTRVGNIGIMTVSDMISKHDSLFSKYISFYDKLFQMFADEYLYVGEEVD